ncbi:hypothetical protein F4604DRAFT_2042990 [Suillus subluteus]|nr:hypothetical protein F4604DRAFT_2042990 [Suillus subluteus]
MAKLWCKLSFYVDDDRKEWKWSTFYYDSWLKRSQDRLLSLQLRSGYAEALHELMRRSQPGWADMKYLKMLNQYNATDVRKCEKKSEADNDNHWKHKVRPSGDYYFKVKPNSEGSTAKGNNNDGVGYDVPMRWMDIDGCSWMIGDAGRLSARKRARRTRGNAAHYAGKHSGSRIVDDGKRESLHRVSSLDITFWDDLEPEHLLTDLPAVLHELTVCFGDWFDASATAQSLLQVPSTVRSLKVLDWTFGPDCLLSLNPVWAHLTHVEITIHPQNVLHFLVLVD